MGEDGNKVWSGYWLDNNNYFLPSEILPNETHGSFAGMRISRENEGYQRFYVSNVLRGMSIITKS